MRIAIIGAGITGVTTAYYLSKKGVEVIGKSATHLAEYEQLFGHALSIRSRMRRN